MKHKQTKYLYLLTSIFGIAPFIVYFWERAKGILPSENVWYDQITNHGPWREGWEGFLVFDPILILIFITVAILLGNNSLKDAEKKYISVLLALQILTFLLQLFVLTWTID